MAAPVKVAKQQTTPELSGTFRTLPPEPTPAYTGTLRNLPEPSGTCLRNLHHFTPELSGTFRNLPPELTPFYKGTLRNLPEPASRTYTGTLRNSPEPSSGTCSCDPHRHTPELIWAEDPISLRCWGKINGPPLEIGIKTCPDADFVHSAASTQTEQSKRGRSLTDILIILQTSFLFSSSRAIICTDVLRLFALKPRQTITSEDFA